MAKVVIEEQIAEVEHTLRWRRAKLQRWMDQEQLSYALADRKITCMEGALATLKFVAKHRAAIKAYIAASGEGRL